MQLPIFHVDAFSGRVFGGNPAAVCPLEAWLPDSVMQNIALENNLSETAFFVRDGARVDLRWFTPTNEVDLCGHATLASAFVLFEELGYELAQIAFTTRSGELQVEREGKELVMNFPARVAEPCAWPESLINALGGPKPLEVHKAPYWLVVYEDEAALRAVAPDFKALAREDPVIVTAPGTSVDFLSRFFAPSHGVDEDPVTGSAHCTLAPYWAQRLGKLQLSARQISTRGGELRCTLVGERVLIAGHAALYLRGTISV